ncbi:hypothetical protein [Speluncibacter jeojiensis]|uniref:Uncharacterized protein n=1 Tax=Speluncibacter jeojiensis TaxID=2710754 RepID=A0A9X4M1J1_9ACTN|nr:hypothetical protein [Rhodococcus sp. D2-41]MDG3014682.1 hypothetical protein [Corynebacteriales bacterium D3-21]
MPRKASRKLTRAVPVVLAAATTLLIGAGTASADTFGPLPPANPFLGPMGTATMHGDAESSDSTPLPGPGTGSVNIADTPLASACPTILQGSDGIPQALCTTIANRTPTVHLLDPATGHSTASLSLTKGSLLGGVYAYLDDKNQMVTVDGSGDLLRIGHDRGGPGGTWRLFVASRTDITAAVSGHCGGGDCDHVAALMPDQQGRVWFATDNASAGYVDPATGQAQSIVLAPGEGVDNSISTAPEGVAITTDHAQYLLDAVGGAPHIVWRQAYDRGPARKPGQLSWGSGASPTFFGPRTGTEYLAITDNAVPTENLIVYNSATGSQVCTTPAINGTENSPIGSGNSVFVASTYGYPYPALPANAGPSRPSGAPITGGMTRIDVNPDGNGCTVKWSNNVRSSAVPRLSVADGKIYTVAREPALGGGSSGSAAQGGFIGSVGGAADSYRYTVIDASTGKVDAQQNIGTGAQLDTLQMVGTIAPGKVQYQGTVTGVLRIASR